MTLDELEVHCLLAILSGNNGINPSHAVKQATTAAKLLYDHQTKATGE
jgi:hypothetical protein